LSILIKVNRLYNIVDDSQKFAELIFL